MCDKCPNTDICVSRDGFYCECAYAPWQKWVDAFDCPQDIKEVTRNAILIADEASRLLNKGKIK